MTNGVPDTMRDYREVIAKYDRSLLTKDSVTKLASESKRWTIKETFAFAIFCVVGFCIAGWFSIFFFALVTIGNPHDVSTQFVVDTLVNWIHAHWWISSFGVIAGITIFSLIYHWDKSSQSTLRREAINASRKMLSEACKPLYTVCSEPLVTAIRLTVRNNATGKIIEEEIIDEVDIDEAAILQSLWLKEYSHQTGMSVLDEYLRQGFVADPLPLATVDVAGTHAKLAAERAAYYHNLPKGVTSVRVPEAV